MKIHVVLNSHLDPVWLWHAEQGMDEVISTAESNCDILEDYPEAIITRGEAWFYEILDKYAPAVFEKVKNYIKQGRWEVVGGWYIQPDCNFPDTYSIRNQSVVSAPVWKKLGVKPSVGYNVDSFGHTASLPDYYISCGMDSYVMMRPGEHEMHLPGCLFRWESPSGNSITTCRLAVSYCTHTYKDMKLKLESIIAATDEKIGHNMFFVGVGDHGGGPARFELDWLREHKNDYPGVEIVISSPRRFFDEISDKLDLLPVVKDELQQHAIGCYTILHNFKRQIRTIEDQLQICDFLLEHHPELVKELPEKNELDKAKKLLAFNEFHDTLAGTCIKTSYDQAYAELGRASSIAHDFAVGAVRLQNQYLAPDNRQQLIFDNFSRCDYRGVFSFEPWLTQENSEDYLRFTLKDCRGNIVPHQLVQGEAAVLVSPRIVFPLELKSGERKILFIDRSSGYQGEGDRLEYLNAAINWVCDHFSFKVMKDNSDTWSHRLTRYTGEVEYSWAPDREKFFHCENGSLLSSARTEWQSPVCRIILTVLKYAGEKEIRLKMQIGWHGRQQLLKLHYHAEGCVEKYTAGCPGGELERAVDGRELPLHNFVQIGKMALVSRDIYAIDSPGEDSADFRMTLLRSPYYANHEPCEVKPTDDFPLTEQGEFYFDLTVIPEAVRQDIEAEVIRQRKIIMSSECTRGCNRDYFSNPHRE